MEDGGEDADAAAAALTGETRRKYRRATERAAITTINTTDRPRFQSLPGSGAEEDAGASLEERAESC